MGGTVNGGPRGPLAGLQYIGTRKAKDEITIDMLDYGYIDECEVPDDLRGIIMLLKSGKEGLYPDLERYAENRLLEVVPEKERNKLIAINAEPTHNEVSDTVADLNGWASEVGQFDKELKHNKGTEAKELPTIRGQAPAPKKKKAKAPAPAPAPTNAGAGQPKEITDSAAKHTHASEYFRSWEKYDADAACEEVDEADAKRMAAIQQEKLDLEDRADRRQREAQEEIAKLGSHQQMDFTGMSERERKYAAVIEKQKGNESFKASEFTEALLFYSRSIALDPHSAVSYSNRALVYLREKMFEKAETDCDRALEVDPGYIKALSRRGMTRHRRGKYQAAIADFEEALRREPDNRDMAALLEKSRSKHDEVEGETQKRNKGFKKVMIMDCDDDDSDSDTSDDSSSDEDSEEEGAGAAGQADAQPFAVGGGKFTASDKFRGAVAGHVFKKGESGIGYYNEGPAAAPPKAYSRVQIAEDDDSDDSDSSDEEEAEEPAAAAAAPAPAAASFNRIPIADDDSDSSDEEAAAPAPAAASFNRIAIADDDSDSSDEEAAAPAPAAASFNSSPIAEEDDDSSSDEEAAAPAPAAASFNRIPIAEDDDSSSDEEAEAQPKTAAAAPAAPATSFNRIPIADDEDDSSSEEDNQGADAAAAQLARALALKDGGAKHFQAGEFEQAFAAFQACAAALPAAGGAHAATACACYNNSSLALLQIGRAAEALGQCDRALAIEPANIKAGMRRATALEQLGHTAEALAQLRAVASSTGDGTGATVRGLPDQLARLARVVEAADSEAEAAAEAAAAAAEAAAEAAAAGAGAAKQEEEAAQAALAEADAAKGAGNKAVQQAQLPRALEHYGAALAAAARAAGVASTAAAARATSLAVLANRAMVQLKANAWGAALADCEAALRLDPKHLKCHFRRGQALRSLGRLRDAVGCLDNVLALEPDNGMAIAERASVVAALKEEEAAADAKTAVVAAAQNKAKEEARRVRQAEQQAKKRQADQAAAAKATAARAEKAAAAADSKGASKKGKKEKAAAADGKAQAAPAAAGGGAYYPTPGEQVQTFDKAVAVAKPSGADSAAALKSPTAPPKSGYEFERVWRTLRADLQGFSAYMTLLPPKAYKKVFKGGPEDEVFVCMLRALQAHLVSDDGPAALVVLQGLTNSGRFSTLLMFLGADDKARLVGMFDALAAAGVEGTAAVRTAYKL
jgi:tetratricopeptide (TPR) repeat protein